MSRSGVLLGAGLAAALASGCTVGPNYRPPTPTALGADAGYAAPAPAPAAAPTDLSAWWTRFDDPILTDLVARATASNLQIAQSAARLVQAREARVQAQAARLPALTGSLGDTRTVTRAPSTGLVIGSGDPATGGGVISTGGNSSTSQLSLGLDASWQADLFGGLRRSVEAARAAEDSSRFDLEAIRTSIAGEVATNYIDARLAQARLAIARDTLKTQDDNLQIAGWRVQAGLVSALDEEQARVQRAQTAASIPTIETSLSSAVNRLAVLTGRPPGALNAELAGPRPIPADPNGVALGIPADTLRNRPDVRSAERQLAAATARIGVAKAALYPALSITGSLNTAAGGVGGLGRQVTSQLFAGLTQTLFDGGALHAQVRSARAGADLAFATYKQTVLTGLEDVENAADSLDAARRRQAELVIARDAANTAALYARNQYGSGLTDFLTLLQSEQSLLSARDALVAVQADQSLAMVQLYLALGGGWEPAALPGTGPKP